MFSEYLEMKESFEKLRDLINETNVLIEKTNRELGSGVKRKEEDKKYLTNKDIQELAGCGKNKACEIRKRAIIKYDGFNPLLPKLVKKEAVMKVLEEKI